MFNFPKYSIASVLHRMMTVKVTVTVMAAVMVTVMVALAVLVTDMVAAAHGTRQDATPVQDRTTRCMVLGICQCIIKFRCRTLSPRAAPSAWCPSRGRSGFRCCRCGAAAPTPTWTWPSEGSLDRRNLWGPPILGPSGHIVVDVISFGQAARLAGLGLATELASSASPGNII